MTNAFNSFSGATLKLWQRQKKPKLLKKSGVYYKDKTFGCVCEWLYPSSSFHLMRLHCSHNAFLTKDQPSTPEEAPVRSQPLPSVRCEQMTVMLYAQPVHNTHRIRPSTRTFGGLLREYPLTCQFVVYRLLLFLVLFGKAASTTAETPALNAGKTAVH